MGEAVHLPVVLVGEQVPVFDWLLDCVLGWLTGVACHLLDLRSHSLHLEEELWLLVLHSLQLAG